MKVFYKLIVVGSVLWLLGSMQVFMAASLFDIDTSDTNKGVVHVKYQGATKKRLKIMIEKGNKKYTYDLNSEGEKESFSLQMGSGTYKIKCLQNVKDQSYALIESKAIQVSLINEEEVYLNAIQNVNWNSESKAIVYAASLTKDIKENPKKINKLYSHLVEGEYQYDYDKLAQVLPGYIPSIDETYQDKTGICYDFSALYGAMLRSQGIPAKLVKGYTTTTEGYHAWNEVYDAKNKKWFIVDTTYDIQVNKVKVKAKMIKEAKGYDKINEY